jgi:hypothetical protein
MISGRRAIEKHSVETLHRKQRTQLASHCQSTAIIDAYDAIMVPAHGQTSARKPSSHTRTPRVSHALLSQSRDADARGIIDWLLLLGPHQFHGTIELGCFHLA